MNKKEKTQRGITLIALVITIIVMLILVGVTISMAVNGGLFDYAGKAAGETKNALNAEQQLANGGIEIGGKWYNSIDEYLIASGNKAEPVEPISKTTSYVGCYADVDGDGDVDGVIYVDLAFSKEANYWYGYSYEAIAAEELKDYKVSGTYDGAFNEEGTPKEVVTTTGEGKDRFYVMALEDFTEAGNTYCWYYSAWDNEVAEVVTNTGFGAGKANTVTMIEKWNTSAFGTQNGDTTYNYKDIWGPIQDSAEYDIVETGNDSNKWFVPSIAELDAFADAFDVDQYNYSSRYGLSSWYLSSSQWDPDNPWYIGFDFYSVDNTGCPSNCSTTVRLSATF